MQNDITDYSKPWNSYTFVAFDTETTGKYPLMADVCEIAAVKWQNGQIVDTYQTFCKPRRLMDQQVINIHKITNEMVSDAPQISQVMSKFNDFISGSVLIAHHAPFDLGFLAVEFEKLGMNLPGINSICSCLLARKVFPKMINHRLATLAANLGVKQSQAHRALDDSKVCLEVALKCMEQLGPVPLDEVFKVQGGACEWPQYSMKTLEKEAKFAPLIAASRDKLVVELVYTGGSAPGVPRRATALGLVRNPEGDYFVGECHKENIEKRFYLNRVISAKILD